MPQFWQIGATQWINPAHIVHVEDDPTATPPLLSVLLPTPAVGIARPSQEPHKLRLAGESRERLLAYLARETEPVPPPASE
jgi:hypothetical protein